MNFFKVFYGGKNESLINLVDFEKSSKCKQTINYDSKLQKHTNYDTNSQTL